MSTWVARIACLIAVLVGGLSDSRATDDLAEFNAAVEEVSAHNRVAIGYLRTENVDFAALEIDRMRTPGSPSVLPAIGRTYSRGIRTTIICSQS